MTQDGTGGRDQYNVEGPVTVNNVFTSSETRPDQHHSISPQAAASGGGGLLVLLVIAVIFFAQNSFQEPFPDNCDARPKTAKKSIVLASIVEWIENCAAAFIAKPANCPQSLDEPVGPDTKIKWDLHGDPTDGARVCFHKSDGIFHVLGGTVMVARYEDWQSAALKVVPLYYWAKLKWRNGQAEVETIDAYNGTPQPTIKKDNPNVPWGDLARTVREAFTRCASTTSTPMPPGCPADTGLPFGAEQVSWTIDGDPTATARPSFDAQHGIIHVKGSYSITARSKTSGEQLQTQKSNYDALIIAEASTLTVLEIAQAS